MSTSRAAVVIDGLVAAATGAGLTVVDGPPTQGIEVGSTVVYVGWQGPETNESASLTQEWVGMGNRARNETGRVSCYAETRMGSTTMKPTRDATLAATAAIESVVRADPQLAVLTGPDYVQYGGTDRLDQSQDSAGSRCGVLFHIDLFARL